MPSDVSSAEQSFRIKEDGGFFSRLVAKEASVGNSSSRVLYYGEASVGVPFMWESKPGTPKHPLSETSLLPPLTPPPSYTSKSKPNPRNPNKKTTHRIISGILRALLAGSGGKVHASSSSYSSSSSSSSLSLGYYSSSPSFSVRSATSKLGIALRYKHRISPGCTPFGNIKNVILKIVRHGGAA
ncbi:uncharacterized protein LOC114735285 [Neltuma alba]|uniref:uncharacterized protein LOC114735285 n=1 Tax=Neltuma alba TaxID=207710 RepID=UPI0010A36A48|nr:uncharacterized protein LOC114735285 [Prosopis alba]